MATETQMNNCWCFCLERAQEETALRQAGRLEAKGAQVSALMLIDVSDALIVSLINTLCIDSFGHRECTSRHITPYKGVAICKMSCIFQQ